MPSIYIKNMVCPRCIMAVEQELINNNIKALEVNLGEVILEKMPNSDTFEHFRKALGNLGFEIIDDKKKQTVEQIKNLIVQQVHHQNDELKTNLSEYLVKNIGHDYSYLSNLFSEIESTTIERFYIAQKIEKVKELLSYHQLTLSQIADQLNYSSVAYLSAQFKKVTGMSASEYKSLANQPRKPLDQV